MSKRWKIGCAFASVYLLWGSTFVAIRYLAQMLHPAFVAGLRYVIAGALLFAWLVVRKRPLRLSGHELWRLLGIGLIMFTLNTILVSYGAAILPAAITALFVSSIPLFIALLQVFTPGARSGGVSVWLGVLGGFGGLVLLMRGGLRSAIVPRDAAKAYTALTVAAIAWAVGSLVSQRIAFRTPLLLATAWQMVCCGAIDLSIGIVLGGLHTSHWNLGVMLATFYLGIFGSLAGYTAYGYLLRNVRLSSAATYAYVNPVVAVLLAWPLLHETLGRTQQLAMGIIVASVALVIASRPDPKRPEVPSLEAASSAAAADPD